jgi:aspartokinase/homoserine dehydrogenase 1
MGRGLRGPDNIFQFRTRRYREQPLTVQGPGAGPEVTAAGVIADLLSSVGVL